MSTADTTIARVTAAVTQLADIGAGTGATLCDTRERMHDPTVEVPTTVGTSRTSGTEILTGPARRGMAGEAPGAASTRGIASTVKEGRRSSAAIATWRSATKDTRKTDK
jgi:hypothetical protein